MNDLSRYEVVADGSSSDSDPDVVLEEEEYVGMEPKSSAKEKSNSATSDVLGMQSNIGVSLGLMSASDLPSPRGKARGTSNNSVLPNTPPASPASSKTPVESSRTPTGPSPRKSPSSLSQNDPKSPASQRSGVNENTSTADVSDNDSLEDDYSEQTTDPPSIQSWADDVTPEIAEALNDASLQENFDM